VGGVQPGRLIRLLATAASASGRSPRNMRCSSVERGHHSKPQRTSIDAAASRSRLGKRVELSSAPTTAKHLLERNWIEREGTGMDTMFRLTEEGLAAKKAPIPLRR
jgi:hypothetical protein